MSKHEDYLQEYNIYANEALNQNVPTGNHSLQSGTVGRMETFIEDFNEKFKIVEKLLVNKANSLLDEAGQHDDLDTSKLKNDLSEMGKSAIGNFVSKYKPK